jgi:hypothetical protein
MHVITEAEACRWLGRRVSLIDCAGGSPATGRLQHVSTRSAFLLQEAHSGDTFAGTVRAIPLARIERIVAAESEG